MKNDSKYGYFDLFLSSYVEKTMVKHLGKRTCEMIKTRLKENYNKELYQVIRQDTGLFEDVLYFIFGDGKDRLMKTIFGTICTKSKKTNGIILTNTEFGNMFADVICDEHKMKIMMETMGPGQSKTRKELCSIVSTKFTEKETIAKISDLVQKQLLVPNSNGVEITYGNILQEFNFIDDRKTRKVEIFLNEEYSNPKNICRSIS